MTSIPFNNAVVSATSRSPWSCVSPSARIAAAAHTPGRKAFSRPSVKIVAGLLEVLHGLGELDPVKRWPSVRRPFLKRTVTSSSTGCRRRRRRAGAADFRQTQKMPSQKPSSAQIIEEQGDLFEMGGCQGMQKAVCPGFRCAPPTRIPPASHRYVLVGL